ncbi:MAG: hypothetical protein ICV60_24425 [Pyrinomonadaceae bacterium]|nr:hypothetical protein [Pyrinomonadaceae bacterium]
MSSFIWQIFDAAEDVAREQHQGGAVDIQDVRVASETSGWTVEETERTLPAETSDGGAVELALARAPACATQGKASASWGLSKGAKDFAFVFLVLILGTIILVVAMRDQNLTFGKLVEDLGLLVAGIAGGGALVKLREDRGAETR